MSTRRDHPILAALGLLVLVAALVLAAPAATETGRRRRDKAVP
jgi:hypothetical protein